MSEACEGCGGPVPGLLCPACGRATRLVGDPAMERRALEELHGAVGKASEEASGRLLANGFLPSAKAVLVEAGLRCVALVNDATPYHLKEGALGRLAAVSAKLRLLGADAEGVKALERFESLVQEARASARRDLLAFAAVAVLLLALAMAVGLLVVYR